MTPPAVARPLEGLRVVECATYVAGPSGGMALSQLGAEVIRVDPIGGATDYRRWPLAPSGESLYWTSLNRGKRSVVVDLRSPAGQELVTALIVAPGPDGGVLLDNNVRRPWLTWPVLSQIRSDLVHVHVQGHRDGRPAVDYTVNAAVGIPQMTGSVADEPVNHVLPAWDLLTGSTAAVGVLAALRRRDRSGEGSLVEVALADVALAGVASLGWFADAQLSRQDRPAHGNHVYGSFGVDFTTADGRRVMVVALTESQWRALCQVTGTSAVFDALQTALGVDLQDEESRYQHRETIAAILRGWFATRDLATVSLELEVARVLWGPYRTMTDVVHDHDGAPETSSLQLVEQPGIGPILGMGSPLRWHDAVHPPSPAPALGADTDAVLADVLGLSSAEIGRLHRNKVVAAADSTSAVD